MQFIGHLTLGEAGGGNGCGEAVNSELFQMAHGDEVECLGFGSRSHSHSSVEE
jgi:hypothetical protein